MEKRIGTALILIEDKEAVHQMNAIASNHSEIIIGRQGLPRSNGHCYKSSCVIKLIFLHLLTN